VPSLTAGRNRSRVVYAAAVVITIGLGLASRHWPSPVSAVFGKYPGDALWAMMVFFGWAALRPKDSTGRIALLALASCVVIEVLKLYQAPWIVGIRHTVIGHLVFGHVFSVENLVAYTAGVAVAVGAESVLSTQVKR